MESFRVSGTWPGWSWVARQRWVSADAERAILVGWPVCDINVAATYFPTSRPPGDGAGSSGACGVGPRRGANHPIVSRKRDESFIRAKERAILLGWPVCDINVAATYFPTSVRGSIIGPPELNGRVRDGNGCDLRGIATTKS